MVIMTVAKLRIDNFAFIWLCNWLCKYLMYYLYLNNTSSHVCVYVDRIRGRVLETSLLNIIEQYMNEDSL